MKVLLVRPDTGATQKGVEKVGGHHQPIGLMYIGSNLLKNGIDVKISDEMIGDSTEDMILSYEPDVLGVSVRTPCYKRVKDIVTFAKERNIFVVLGDAHSSALPEQTLKGTGADAVVAGEGEEAMLEICISRKKGVIRGIVKDIESLPFPSRELIDLDKYAGTVQFGFPMKKGERSTQVITSRGCPNLCTFCSNNIIFGRIPRYRSVENVISELKEIKEKYGISTIIFDDDTFTLDQERVKKICERIKPLNLRWSCQLRVTVSKETLKTMKDAGCEMVAFGVESGSDEMLKRIKKGITKELVVKAFREAREVGLRTKAFFMVGLPGETEQDFKDSLELACKINPDYLWLSCFTALPGCEEYKDIDESEWEKLMYFKPTNEIIAHRYKTFLKKYYLRTGYMRTFLKRFSFKEAKYMFSLATGFFGNKDL